MNDKADNWHVKTLRVEVKRRYEELDQIDKEMNELRRRRAAHLMLRGSTWAQIGTNTDDGFGCALHDYGDAAEIYRKLGDEKERADCLFFFDQTAARFEEAVQRRRAAKAKIAV